jgi:hypothetical protein
MPENTAISMFLNFSYLFSWCKQLYNALLCRYMGRLTKKQSTKPTAIFLYKPALKNKKSVLQGIRV